MNTGQIKTRSKLRQDQAKFREDSFYIQKACGYTSEQLHHLMFEIGMITADRMLFQFYEGQIPQEIRKMWLQDKALGYWTFWKKVWFEEQRQFIRLMREGVNMASEFEIHMEHMELKVLDKKWNYHRSRN